MEWFSSPLEDAFASSRRGKPHCFECRAIANVERAQKFEPQLCRVREPVSSDLRKLRGFFTHRSASLITSNDNQLDEVLK